MTIAVRPYEPQDAATLGAAWVEAYVDDGYVDESRRDRIADVELWLPHRILVAEDDGTVVGGLVVVGGPGPGATVARDGETELRALGVARAARGRGAATALVVAAIETSRAAVAQAVVLWTRPQMTTAQRLYENLGFVRVRDRDFELAGERMLTYRLVL